MFPPTCFCLRSNKVLGQFFLSPEMRAFPVSYTIFRCDLTSHHVIPCCLVEFVQIKIHSSDYVFITFCSGLHPLHLIIFSLCEIEPPVRHSCSGICNDMQSGTEFYIFSEVFFLEPSDHAKDVGHQMQAGDHYLYIYISFFIFYYLFYYFIE